MVILGPGPNRDPYKLLGPNGQYLKPIDMLDAAAQRHDYSYNLAHTGGIKGALSNLEVRKADLILAAEANIVIMFAALMIKDPISNKYITEPELRWAIGVTALFGDIGAAKYTTSLFIPSPTK